MSGIHKFSAAKRWRTQIVVAAGAAAAVALGAGVSLAATSSSSSGQLIRLCVNARFRQVTQPTGTGACPSGYFLERFNKNLTPTPGPRGPAGPQGPAGTPTLYESTVNDAPNLQIDMAPGPQGLAGSSGWGWDNTTNAPITSLTVGTTNGFTVTVLQPGTESADGTITLSWDPYDFTYVSNGDATATCTAVPQTSAETCTYTDLSHSAKSDSFQFKANNVDPDAVIGVTVDVNGEQATGQFPVQIVK